MILVVAILVAAVVVGWRSPRRDAGLVGVLLPPARPAGDRSCRVVGRGRRRPRARPGRRRAILVVTTLVGGLVLIGVPASAQAFDCKAPPDPDRPGTGLVGSLDPAPIGVGAPGSVYDEAGYAGQVWWTYDLGCGPGGARDPAAATDTWLGNQVFDVAKLIVAGVNWSHYLIERGSGLLTPLDGIIQAGTQAMYKAVFTTWIGLALLVLAAILLVLAMRGDLSAQAKRGGVAVIALALAAGAYAAPIQWSKALDGVMLDGVTAMQRGFLSQIGVGDANTLPTVLTDQVVYTNWLRGEFGSADVPQARDLGRDLLRAQTFTKQEVANHQDGQPQADAKKGQFTAVAGKVGDRYSYFQGKQGSRTGAGVLALIQAACIGLFQLMSKLLVLVSMLVIRLLVMVAPALAVVALLKPEILPATLRVGGAALVNTLLVGALAGLHSLLVIALFRAGSGVDIWLALLVTGVVTVLLWAVARPFRRLASMVALTRDQMSGILPEAGSGVLGRALSRFRGAESERQSSWWEDRRTTASAGSGWRPEAHDAAGDAVATAGATASDGSPIRVASQRVAGADAVDPAARAADATRLVGSRGRGAAALPAGRDAGSGSLGGSVGSVGTRSGSGPGEPVRATVAEADRSLYRRVAERGPGRPVEAELVDGAPVYRIYRPSRPVGSGGGTRRDRSGRTPGGTGADPD